MEHALQPNRGKKEPRKSAVTRLARTHAIIIDAASRTFLEFGFTGTSMDQVAAAASVSKQTVYSHFRSKEALFVAVVGSMTGAADAAILPKLDMPMDIPLERYLLDFAIGQVSIVRDPGLMRLRRLVIAEAERFPDLGKALHENGPGRTIKRLTTAFEHHRERGDLIVADARSAATFFNWLLMGGPANDVMLLGEAGVPTEAELKAHAREAVRIFLAAFGAT
jgi:TetR/AcrR family transcriptional repressor of mexJK operon